MKKAQPTRGGQKRPHMTIEGRKSLSGWLFILPFTVGFLLFFLFPAVQSLLFSFNDVTVDVGSFAMSFRGWENYRYIFTEEPDFNKNLVAALLGTLKDVPVILIASLFFALLLNQRFHGRGLVRAIFFLPVIIASGVVMNIINSDSFATSLITSSEGMEQTVSATSFGLQELLISMGLSSGLVEFFTSMMWRTGIQMIIFLAALQTISPSLYEASSIEGASAWENFWMITIPMITPMILVNLVYTVVDTFTNGSNAVMEMVTQQTRIGKYNVASAMSWTYFLIIGILLGVILLLFSRMQADRPRKER